MNWNELILNCELLHEARRMCIITREDAELLHDIWKDLREAFIQYCKKYSRPKGLRLKYRSDCLGTTYRILDSFHGKDTIKVPKSTLNRFRLHVGSISVLISNMPDDPLKNQLSEHINRFTRLLNTLL